MVMTPILVMWMLLFNSHALAFLPQICDKYSNSMPMQYMANFNDCKMTIISLKFLICFLIFAQKLIDCGNMIE